MSGEGRSVNHQQKLTRHGMSGIPPILPRNSPTSFGSSYEQRNGNNYNPGKLSQRSMAINNGTIETKVRFSYLCKPYDISRTKVDTEQKIKNIHRLQHLSKSIHL